MSFEAVLNDYPWDTIRQRINDSTSRDVEAALQHENPGLKGLIALLSPAAEPYLETMAQMAHRITRSRFGRVIQMYVPLYLGNECTNACVYCGFSRKNEVKRRTLTLDEAIEEGNLLLDEGFRHLLLVSGESPKHVNAASICRVVNGFSGSFASMAIEVQPMSVEDYAMLIEHGVDSLVSYQETYNKAVYGDFHPKGPKRDFSFRLSTAERGGEAGFRRVGIGALLGLADWRAEGFFLGLHAAYLQKKYWRTQVTVSFPRLRPCAGSFSPPHPADDKALALLICALRIMHPDCGLVLSTREPAELRQHLMPLGITQMSAGSRTEPGGYSQAGDAEEQFKVIDDRSPEQVAGDVAMRGYEPVWKDWDASFLEKPESKAKREHGDHKSK